MKAGPLCEKSMALKGRPGPKNKSINISNDPYFKRICKYFSNILYQCVWRVTSHPAVCLEQSSNAARRRSRRSRCWWPVVRFHWVPAIPASAVWLSHSRGGWCFWPVPARPGTPGAPQGSESGCFYATQLSSGHSWVRSIQTCTVHSYNLQSCLKTTGVEINQSTHKKNKKNHHSPVHLQVWLKNLVGQRSLSSTFLSL